MKSLPLPSTLGRTLLLLVLVTLSGLMTAEAQSRTGTLLYDVPFASPPHTVGAAPATHPQNAAPPRNAPSDVYGDPSVALAVGNLVDQPCSFGISDVVEELDELRFITGRFYPNGFPNDEFELYHIELNVAVHQLAGGSYFVIAIGNTHTITFIGGAIIATGAPGGIGTYQTDVPVFVEVDVWLPAQSWTIRLNGQQVLSANYAPPLLDFVRLISYSYNELDQVGVDDLKICGGGTCQPAILIQQQPADQLACTGHEATFSVLATGTPPLQYQWLHNTLEIQGATSQLLTLQAVGHADAGVYKVRVWNLLDSLESYPASLSVNDHVAVALQPSPSTQTVCRGDTVWYAASAIGTGPYTWRWRRNGEFVPGQVNPTFYDTAIDTSEAGVYDAIVSNACSSDTTTAVTLAVDMAPQITLQPVGQTVCTGDNLSFSTAATGRPAPTLQWYKGGNLLPGQTGNILAIISAQAGNAGLYTVRASNACGVAVSDEAALTVLPMTITVPTQAATIQAGIDAVCGQGGVVTVLDGTYTGVGNRDISFRGKRITVQSASGNPLACVIDCQRAGRGFVFNSGETSAAVLEGFTIRRGEVFTQLGGAIHCNGASPTIRHCILEDSHAKAGGGMAGIYFSGSLVRCTFKENRADSLGGGLLLANNSEPSPAANCTFYANSALFGGGIGISASNLTLASSIISFSGRGASITCQNMYGHSLVITCCDFFGNAGGDWNEPCILGQAYTSGNIHLSPLFQDRFDGDLTLQANSPCAPFRPTSPTCDLMGAWPANAVFSDDDGIPEYGVEYIDDYPGTDNDRHIGVVEADSLEDVLGGWGGWQQRFRNSDGDARWQHWGDPEEDDVIDEADLVYFSGHGTFDLDLAYPCNSSAVMFRTANLLPSDCDGRWGNHDVEWLGFSCCELLNDEDRSHWAAAFDGAHLILGYKTLSKQRNRAGNWAEQMTGHGITDPAKRVAWSWLRTCDITQVDGRIARVLGESDLMAYDYAWGQEGGPKPDPVVDGSYSFWDHSKGDATFAVPAARSAASLPASLPVYDVLPSTVDSAAVAALGNSLGIYGPVEEIEGRFTMASGNLYLAASAAAGLEYGDLSRLWRPRQEAPILPSLSSSLALATGFLTQHGLLPAGADPGTAIHSDVQGRVNRASGEVEEEFATQVQVVFHRQLGGYPVVGPGGNVLAYVGEGGTVDGLAKVWRSLSVGASLSLLDSAAVLQALGRHGQRLALGGMPVSTQRQLRALGLGYWEEEDGFNQAQVFPVYVLDMNFLRADTLSTRDLIFVPAAEDFMPFLSYIETPARDTVFVLGEPIHFSGGADYGSAPLSLGWLSDRDGWRGGGAALTDSTLSAGEHVISLCASDAAGALDTLRVGVRITAEVDFGDAPAPYPTWLSANGARHLTGGPLWLGAGVDNEVDGVPDAAALGDDLAGVDDEDGLVFLDEWSPGATTRVVASASAPGLLSLWLDANRDGDWEDEADQLLKDEALAAGADTLELTLPADASMGATFLRARLSTQANLSPTGLALDGEVEDEAVEIACGLPCPVGALPESEPCGQRLNNGCNLALPAFIDLDCGDTWCAETWASGGRRDSDWYALQVEEPTRLRLTVESEIDLYAGLVEQFVPGLAGCANITGQVLPVMALSPCQPDTLELDLPAAGTYYLITLPPVYTGFACEDGPYRLVLGVDCIALQPELSIEVVEGVVRLAWPPVAGAVRYHVWSAAEAWPTSWTRETPAAGIADTSWSEACTSARKFYRVTAESTAARSALRHLPPVQWQDDATQPTRKPDAAVLPTGVRH